jgi:hypothetical protein
MVSRKIFLLDRKLRKSNGLFVFRQIGTGLPKILTEPRFAENVAHTDHIPPGGTNPKKNYVFCIEN